MNIYTIGLCSSPTVSKRFLILVKFSTVTFSGTLSESIKIKPPSALFTRFFTYLLFEGPFKKIIVNSAYALYYSLFSPF